MTAPPAPPAADTLETITSEALDAVEEIFNEYVIFPSPEARDAAVLWVAHAHVFHAFESTPRLSIRSKGPGSGKSRVLEIIHHLVPSPVNVIDVEPAVLWRSIEHEGPTILLDEADTVFGKNGSSGSHRRLRAIINAGHKKSAKVRRCVGAEDVKAFTVFAPVALAGIGRLPDTIATRSVEIVMRKRAAGEEVRSFRLKFAQDVLDHARDLLESWSMDAGDILEMSFPDMPVQDRDADVWEPLLSIAEMAGEDWFKRAWKACEELTRQDDAKVVSPGVRILTELHRMFGDAPVMFTADILASLAAVDGSPWTNLTPRGLSNILREYRVRPTTVRQGEDVAKGFKREDLAPVWAKFTVTGNGKGDDDE